MVRVCGCVVRCGECRDNCVPGSVVCLAVVNDLLATLSGCMSCDLI